MVVLLLVAALRPAIPGNDVRVDASAVDVYLVVDTTSSVMARDYADARPRLEGVRADIKALTTQLAGARFALTFDIDTTVRLPLTSDGAAVSAAADTLRPETSVWSRGSSVTIARDQPDRPGTRPRHAPGAGPPRLLLRRRRADGAQDPRPFDIASQLINGGAVLGYGTAAGGRMAITAAFETGDIVDPSTASRRSRSSTRSSWPRSRTSSGCRTSTAPPTTGASRSSRGYASRSAPLRATDSGEIVGGRAELGWVALCCWRSSPPGRSGLSSPPRRSPGAPSDLARPRRRASHHGPVCGWPPCGPTELVGDPRRARRSHARSTPPSCAIRSPRVRSSRPEQADSDDDHQPAATQARRPGVRRPNRLTGRGGGCGPPTRRPRGRAARHGCASGSPSGRCRSSSCWRWSRPSFSPWWPSATRRCARTRPATSPAREEAGSAWASSTSSNPTRPPSPGATPGPGRRLRRRSSSVRRVAGPRPTGLTRGLPVRSTRRASLEKLGQAAQTAWAGGPGEAVLRPGPGGRCRRRPAASRAVRRTRKGNSFATPSSGRRTRTSRTRTSRTSRTRASSRTSRATQQQQLDDKTGEPRTAPAGRRAERRRDQAAGRQALVTHLFEPGRGRRHLGRPRELLRHV